MNGKALTIQPRLRSCWLSKDEWRVFQQNRLLCLTPMPADYNKIVVS
jgi:hypothetical protein